MKCILCDERHILIPVYINGNRELFCVKHFNMHILHDPPDSLPEEIDAWVRDIQLLRAHLGHAKDAEPVLPSGTKAAEMRERLLKLRSVLDAMGSNGAITITSSCSPPILKQEYILDILSGLIDAIQWDKLEIGDTPRWKREFLEGLNIPIEFKKKLGYEEKQEM